MKVAVPKDGNTKRAVNVLPLDEEPDVYKLDKTNSVSFVLRTVPTDANSPTYKYLVRVLQGDESPRQILRWYTDVEKVCTGLNATTLEAKRPIQEACMRPGPLSNYHAALNVRAKMTYNAALQAAEATDRTAGNTNASDTVKQRGEDYYRHVDHLKNGLQNVVTQAMPRKVLAKAKRDMRRYMRKPPNMKVRKYYAALQRINDEELPILPPFKRHQSLTPDEVTDIILFGTPKSWQVEMERQGFDPLEHTIIDVVDFMENLEAAEEHSYQKVEGDKKGSKKSSQSDKKPAAKRKAEFYCEHHGQNTTHDTQDCIVLKRRKQEAASGKKKSFPNKTWVRKADESTSFSKKELAAFVKKTVKQAVANDAHAIEKGEKKRSLDSDSDDDDEGECYLLDALSGDLDGFNYDDIDKMNISDDKKDDEPSDEVSV